MNYVIPAPRRGRYAARGRHATLLPELVDRRLRGAKETSLPESASAARRQPLALLRSPGGTSDGKSCPDFPLQARTQVARRVLLSPWQLTTRQGSKPASQGRPAGRQDSGSHCTSRGGGGFRFSNTDAG